MKTCSRCGEVKAIEDYYANGRQPCKPCHRANCKQYRDANRDQVIAKQREWARSEAGRASVLAWKDANRDTLRRKTRERDLFRTYGLTADEYGEMHDAQGGACAICGLDETSIHHRSGEPRALAVDHNHATGAVRGLLCNRCNQAIGLFEDDDVLLIAASIYLQLHKQRKTA